MCIKNILDYNKIKLCPFYIRNMIIQIIELSLLLLIASVYEIKTIDFNEYTDGSLLDIGSLIKTLLFLATFSFMISIILGTWIYYKTKNSYTNNPSKWIVKLIKWFTLGLLVLMMPIPLILLPESDRLFEIYLIVLALAVKYVRDKMLKKMEIENERTCT